MSIYSLAYDILLFSINIICLFMELYKDIHLDNSRITPEMIKRTITPAYPRIFPK